MAKSPICFQHWLWLALQPCCGLNPQGWGKDTLEVLRLVAFNIFIFNTLSKLALSLLTWAVQDWLSHEKNGGCRHWLFQRLLSGSLSIFEVGAHIQIQLLDFPFQILSLLSALSLSFSFAHSVLATPPPPTFRPPFPCCLVALSPFLLQPNPVLRLSFQPQSLLLFQTGDHFLSSSRCCCCCCSCWHVTSPNPPGQCQRLLFLQPGAHVPHVRPPWAS